MRTTNVVACVHVHHCSFSPCCPLPLSFSQWRYKIFVLFLQRTSASLFFISRSRSSSFSVFHVSVDIKIQSKKKRGFVVSSLVKRLGGHAIYRQHALELECEFSLRLTGDRRTGGEVNTRGGGGNSIYPWMGRCGPDPHTMTLLKTKIADFPTMFKTESRFLIPCLRHLTRNHTLCKTIINKNFAVVQFVEHTGRLSIVQEKDTLFTPLPPGRKLGEVMLHPICARESYALRGNQHISKTVESDRTQLQQNVQSHAPHSQKFQIFLVFLFNVALHLKQIFRLKI